MLIDPARPFHCNIKARVGHNLRRLRSPMTCVKDVQWSRDYPIPMPVLLLKGGWRR